MQTKRKNSILSLGAVLLTVIIFNIGTATAFAIEKHEIAPQIMLELTNESRKAAGVLELTLNLQLVSAAEAKVNDMFDNQYFDHESPSGKTPWEFIRSAGYEYSFAGENLAMDFVSAEGVHKAFIKSDSHRENILNAKYFEVGISVKKGMFEGRETIFVVEEFGSPLKQITAIEIAKTEVQVETSDVKSREIKEDQEQKTIQVAAKINSDSERPVENNGQCINISNEICTNGKNRSADGSLAYLFNEQDMFFASSALYDAYEENERDAGNGYVAEIDVERDGDLHDSDPLKEYDKYLAVLDAFEKEIILLLLSFAISMNLYYSPNLNFPVRGG